MNPNNNHNVSSTSGNIFNTNATGPIGPNKKQIII
jgi:hypothetical protein